MEKTIPYNPAQEINSANGCGIDESDELFYEQRKSVNPSQEDSQEELEDLLDSDEVI